MRTIGVIGGVAWPSTAVYYQKINEAIAQRLGGLHCAKLVLAQTDFDLIERYEREGCWDQLGEELGNLGNALKRAGADFFLIACNTVHAAAERIESLVDLPFIHIVDPTAQYILGNGFKAVGLLGSRYTMCGDFFVKRLEHRYGLNVLIPEGVHQDNVHHALYAELARGIFKETTRARFRAAIDDLVVRGAQVIVLGCTEFGLLVKAEDSPVSLVDTTVMHVEAAVNAALADAE
jgi:aspartate racemase